MQDQERNEGEMEQQEDEPQEEREPTPTELEVSIRSFEGGEEEERTDDEAIEAWYEDHENGRPLRGEPQAHVGSEQDQPEKAGANDEAASDPPSDEAASDPPSDEAAGDPQSGGGVRPIKLEEKLVSDDEKEGKFANKETRHRTCTCQVFLGNNAMGSQ